MSIEVQKIKCPLCGGLLDAEWSWRGFVLKKASKTIKIKPIIKKRIKNIPVKGNYRWASDGCLLIWKKAEHKFRLYNGWGAKKSIVKEAVRRESPFIKMFVELENGKEKVYITHPEIWEKHGIPYDYRKKNKTGEVEIEKQLILRDEYFTIRG